MLRRLLVHVRQLLRRRRIGTEADGELRFHLEMEMDAHVARGVSPDDARRMALRDFGGLTQAREGVRRVRTTWADSLWQDTRYALRLWRRQRGFTAAAVLTLAIGIGGTTAIASAVYGVLLRPLPVRDEGSLFVGYANFTGLGDRLPLSWPAYQAWRDAGVGDVAAVSPAQTDLTDGVAERISIQRVSNNFFGVIGLEAAVGRVFSDADAAALDTPALISDALWRSRFGAAASAIGQHIHAGPLDVTIIGVLPRGADRWRESAQMWVPIEKAVAPQQLKVGYHSFTPIMRLDPARAIAAVNRLTPITAAVDGARITAVRLVSLREDVSLPRLARILLIMFSGVCLTWLVVCANLSNLLLTRGPTRAGELTVRLAIGASRPRIVRQLLCESAVLAAPGGALGVLLALAFIGAMASAGTVGAFNASDLELDAPVLGFALILTMASALAAGLAPALTFGRASLARGAASLEVGRASRQWSRALVVVQIAVGLTVLVGASLLVKSLVRIEDVDLGFDAKNVLVFRASLPTAVYGSPASIDDDRYVRPQLDLLRRLSALPGVQNVSFGGAIFSPGVAARTSIWIDDGRQFLNGEPKDAAFAPGMAFVGPSYFAVHGVRVARGREFRVNDDFTAQRVVLINEAMAALFWPDQEALGHHVSFGQARPGTGVSEPWAEIVGIVPNIRHGGVDVPIKPYVYRAATQYPRQDFQVMLRTSVPALAVANAARLEVQAFDPSVPMYATRPLSEIVADASADVRHTSTLLAALAVLTVGLAAVGVFSVLSYVVSARRRELAIRVALGAGPAALTGSVMGQSAWIILPGVLLGLAGSFGAAGALKALLYEVGPTDPIVFGLATAVVILLSLAAAYVPARRAARLDPVRSLKG